MTTFTPDASYIIQPSPYNAYKIVKGMSPDKLENEIMTLINEGWQPQGGLAVSNGYFVQAMVQIQQIGFRLRNSHGINDKYVDQEGKTYPVLVNADQRTTFGHYAFRSYEEATGVSFPREGQLDPEELK